MRCVLHIGTEHTATTTLQGFVYAHRDELSKQGVCLSTVCTTPNNKKLTAWFKDQLDDTGGIRTTSYYDQFCADFAYEVGDFEKEHATMLLTSEHFHSEVNTDTGLAALKEFLYSYFDEVQIVCYFREQSRVMCSMYSTMIKHQSYTGDFDEFYDEVIRWDAYLNYHRMFSKWADTFGKEILAPRLMHEVIGDIRKDFLTLVEPSIDLDAFDYTHPPVNKCLSAPQMEIGRLVNKHLIGPNKEIVLDILREAGVRKGEEFINPRAREVYDHYKFSNIEFSKAFLGVAGSVSNLGVARSIANLGVVRGTRDPGPPANPFPAPDPVPGLDSRNLKIQKIGTAQDQGVSKK